MSSQATPNVLTIDELNEQIEELGAQHGRVKDVQVKTLYRLCEGAYHGLLDLAPNKHGHEIDDATEKAQRYARAQGQTAVFDHKAPNQRKLISTFRTIIKLGGYTKGGVGEPLGNVDKLLDHFRKERRDPTKKGMLKSADNALLDYARAQLKADRLIEDDELFSFVYKKVPRELTAEDKIENIRKQLQVLSQGDAQGVQDSSQQVKDAIGSLTKRLTDIAQARKSHP